VAVGFVPDNSWHVLLPADAADAARAALPQARLVGPLAPHDKVSPEWHAIGALLEDGRAADALLAGASVTRVARGGNATAAAAAAAAKAASYIGALDVERSPSGKPRVTVRVWFPHLTPSDAAALGFNASSAANPTPGFAPHYAAALRQVVRTAAERSAGKQQKQQPAAESAQEEATVQHLEALVAAEAATGRRGAAGAKKAAAAQKAAADECAPTVKSGRYTMEVTVCVEVRGGGGVGRGLRDGAPRHLRPFHLRLSVSSLHATSPTLPLLPQTCSQHLGPVLHWLARRPMVYWVAPRMKHGWNNFAAGAVVQGSPLAARVEDPSEAGGPGLHPIWEAGLRGEGQIVGMGDSGVDMDSCYFYDPKV
jgi:hypothetical protein